MSSNLQLIFGQNLRKYRLHLKLTQAKLSELAELSTSYIGLIENGKMSVSFATIEALASALKIEPYKLFIHSADIRNNKNGGEQLILEAEPDYSPALSRMYTDVKNILDKYQKEAFPTK